MTSKRATVIIPTYNAAPSLARVLASLAVFPESELAAVIVCDDGSADDTEAITSRFAVRLPLSYVRQDDRGFRAAAARNLGICRVESEVAIFIDSDVVVPAGFLGAHLRRHGGPERDRLVFGYRRRVREAPLPNTELARVVDYERDHREAELAPQGLGLELTATPWYFAYSCNLSVSGDLRRQLFDEAFVGWGNEDLEYAYRAVAAGARIECAPEASLWHVDEGHVRDPFRCDPREVYFDSFILNTVLMQRLHAGDPILWERLEADLVGYRIIGDRCVADPTQTDPRPIKAWAIKRLRATPGDGSESASRGGG